jgi:hypothetical protein
MHIEDFKRWHWAVIAIVIGLALSWVWSNVEWGDQLPTMGQPDFERGVVAKYPQPGHIANIVVLPSAEKNVQAVVCEQLRRTKDPRVMEFRPALFRSPVPFKTERDGQSYPTIAAYLNDVKTRNNPDLRFKYAWYRETWAVYLLWTVASVLLIGVVWPSAISLMTGGGLGFTREKSTDPEYDLSRFGKGERSSKPSAGVATSEHDLDEVRRLDEELERQLAAGATASTGATATTSTADQPTRKLDGGPLESANIPTQDEHKQYGGEFYPVVKPAHKPHDDPDHPHS